MHDLAIEENHNATCIGNEASCRLNCFKQARRHYL